MKHLIARNMRYLAWVLGTWLLVDILFVANGSRPIFGFLKLSYITDIFVPIMSLGVTVYIWPTVKKYSLPTRFLILGFSVVSQYLCAMLLVLSLGLVLHFFIGGGV